MSCSRALLKIARRPPHTEPVDPGNFETRDSIFLDSCVFRYSASLIVCERASLRLPVDVGLFEFVSVLRVELLSASSI